ncbi:MAG: hypothetical protein Q8R82_11655 [Hyphomonadaceae bacterium]|nr:hypothetical protein [Hyphomonadaceae bacterium]
MTAAMIFISDVMTIITGAVLRTCGSGMEADMASFWCGPQPSSLMAHGPAHCAGCAMIAAGFILMIIAVLADNLPRRLAASERT